MQDLEIASLCYVSTHRHFLRAREVKNFIQMAHRSVLYYKYPFPLLTKCRKYSVWLFLAKLKKIQGGSLLWIFKIWAIKKSKGRPLLWISKLQSLEKKNKRGPLLSIFEIWVISKKSKCSPLCFGKMMKNSDLKIQKKGGLSLRGGSLFCSNTGWYYAEYLKGALRLRLWW